MTKSPLSRRIGALEQARPVELPVSLQRWLGTTLTDQDNRRADVEMKEINRFVGPADLRAMDADMLSWLSSRADNRAPRISHDASCPLPMPDVGDL